MQNFSDELYDSAGRLIQQNNGNSTFTVYTYDADGDVLSITNYAPSAGSSPYVPDNSTANSFDDYTYDGLGNVLTDTNQDGQWAYTYDADGQLTHAVFTPNNADPDGLAPQDLQYVYDAAGNRVSETVNGVTTAYVSNNVNEYTSSSTNGVTTNYQYDNNGNLIGQTTGGSSTTYTFNQLNELTVINDPGVRDTYAYNPFGDLISQTANGATTNYQVDPAGNVLASFSGTGVYNNTGGLLAHYTYGLGLVSQVSGAGVAGYYDFNFLGSTIGISDSTGKYVNRYTYLPFGETTTLASKLANPFLFVGQHGAVQLTTNLLSMGARVYSPMTGQFLSNDPAGLTGGERGYTNNDPTSFIDPAGLWRVRAFFGINFGNGQPGWELNLLRNFNVNQESIFRFQWTLGQKIYHFSISGGHGGLFGGAHVGIETPFSYWHYYWNRAINVKPFNVWGSRADAIAASEFRYVEKLLPYVQRLLPYLARAGEFLDRINPWLAVADFLYRTHSILTDPNTPFNIFRSPPPIPTLPHLIQSLTQAVNRLVPNTISGPASSGPNHAIASVQPIPFILPTSSGPAPLSPQTVSFQIASPNLPPNQGVGLNPLLSVIGQLLGGGGSNSSGDLATPDSLGPSTSYDPSTLVTPGCINWLNATSDDMSLFTDPDYFLWGFELNPNLPTGTIINIQVTISSGTSAPIVTSLSYTIDNTAITTQPANAIVASSQNTTLSVAAGGGEGPYTYQWYTGTSGDTSNPISGATGSLYTAAPTSTTGYWCQVTDNLGAAVDSNTATLTVVSGLTISSQPASAVIDQGQSRTLSVVAVAGTAPYTYQWYTGASGDASSPISGATDSTYPASPASTTSYWVQVKDSAGGTANSNTAVIAVAPTPAVSIQPASAIIGSGQSHPLSVVVTDGNGPFTYQWYTGASGDTSSPISGATDSTYAVAPANSTEYWVQVTDATGVSVNSNTATVTVASRLTLSTQPVSTVIDQGQTDSLSVTAVAGTAPYSYQWYTGISGNTTNPIAGATSSVFTAAPTGTTSYWVQVKDAAGTSINSDTATITVNPGLAISTQPASAIIGTGQSDTLSVTAGGGTTPYRYQWFTTSGGTSSPINSATGSSYTVSPAGTTSYWASITDATGAVIQSSTATVTVATGLTISTQPASRSIDQGQSDTLSVAAVLGTIPYRYQWYTGMSGDTSSPITGASGSSYAASPTTTISYWVRVTDNLGATADSTTAVITVNPALAITTQPSSTTIASGQSANLSVAAVSGTGPYSYQWYTGASGNTASPISGATGSSYTASPTSTTSYWVQVKDGASAALASSTATVTVDTKLTIVTQPSSGIIGSGQSDTLSVVALSGTAPYRYQWFSGSAGDTSRSISGATGSSYNVSPAITSSYWVQVLDQAGAWADSSTATIVVQAQALAAVGGTPQVADTSTAFVAPLQAKVTDATGNPMPGVMVTFVAPSTGAGGTFAGGLTTVTATTDASGVATAPAFTSNSTAGSYVVSASAAGFSTPATFALTNQVPLVNPSLPNTYQLPSKGFNSLAFAPNGALGTILLRPNYPSGLNDVIYHAQDSFGNWSDTLIGQTGTNQAQLLYDSSGKADVLVLESNHSIAHYHLGGTGWSLVETLTPPTDPKDSAANFPYLVAARGTNDSLHVLLAESDPTLHRGRLVYGTNSGGAWAFTVVTNTGDPTDDPYVSQPGRFISLAIDSHNFAHATYTPSFQVTSGSGIYSGDSIDWSQLGYATNASGSWQTQVVYQPPSKAGDAGTGASIAIGPNDQVAIASWYQDRSPIGGSVADSMLLYHTQNPNGTWNTQVVANSSAGYNGTDGTQFTGVTPDLMFDAEGQPIIAFSDEASYHDPHNQVFSGQIREAMWDGAQWRFQTVLSQTDPMNNGLTFPSIALSPTEIAFAGLLRQNGNSYYELLTEPLPLYQPVTIGPATLPGGTVGGSYSMQITASGGSDYGFAYQVSAGTLPPGLTLNASTGLLSGMPYSPGGSPYFFTVTATDSVGDIGSQTYNLTVASPLGASPNAIYVENLYGLLLHRPADPGASYWVGLLNQGVARSTVVEDLESSQEYLTNIVTGIYQHYLNRVPDPGGLSTQLTALQNGETIEQVIAGIVSSPEFYQVAGGSNATFVTALYKDILNRTADSSGYNSWLAALNNGATTRLAMAGAFLASREYQDNLVNSYYQLYLWRPADAGGLAAWTQQLQAGLTDQKVLAAVLGSTEAFGIWSNATYYVGNLYTLLLHRPADAGAAGWVNLLSQGAAPGTVVQDLESSQEYLSDFVTGLYEHYLNRAPDSGGLSSWVSALQNGATIEQVIDAIVSSAEFYQDAGRTNAGFVTALYQDILNRAPDSTGYNNWLAALNNGTTTPSAMAWAFLRSGEYESNLVSSYYQQYLRRPADPGGLAGWTQQLQAGLTDQAVLAAILGSSEAYLDWS